MEPKPSLRNSDFLRRILAAAAIVSLFAVLLMLTWQAIEVLLLFFAGILLGAGLRGIADILHHKLHIPEWSALLVAILGFFVILGVAAWILGPHLVQGIERLSEDIPQSLAQLDQKLQHVEWLQRAIHRATESFGDGIKHRLVSHLAGMFSTALGGITGFLIIIAIGVYLSINPNLYVNGVIRLAPVRSRQRLRQVIAAQGHSLRWWLLGRISSMTVVGILTWAGLMILGIPLAFTLAVIAGLLSFVPNIGPILSALPAVLVGLSVSPMTAVYVIGVYVVVQTVESYLITPFIQQRAVAMPPALLLIVQLIMGVWVGVIGIFLATPLTVALMVAVRMLYIEDVLGDKDAS